MSEKIDTALKEYYDRVGKPVPQWKQRRNPEWWVEYLRELGLDENNR